MILWFLLAQAGCIPSDECAEHGIVECSTETSGRECITRDWHYQWENFECETGFGCVADSSGDRRVVCAFGGAPDPACENTNGGRPEVRCVGDVKIECLSGYRIEQADCLACRVENGFHRCDD